MSTLWHYYDVPSFLSPAPRYSFFDVAEIFAPAPEAYAEARQRMQRWERRMGAVYMQHNAKMAWDAWQRHRPWWLV